MAMYLRFQTPNRDLRSGSPEGLFTRAYELVRSPGVPSVQQESIRKQLRWFSVHFAVPVKFTRTRHSSHKNKHGIGWIKDSASEIIRRMYELSRTVEELGYSVEVVRTSRPGYVVYEDRHQIVAEPFHGESR
jgi:hypothetical protein